MCPVEGIYWKKPIILCCRLVWLRPSSPISHHSRYVHHPYKLYLYLSLSSFCVTFLRKLTGKMGWSWLRRQQNSVVLIYSLNMLPPCFRPERPKRGGLCWLLKQRQMGTFEVKMKGVLPWLVRWARCVSALDFYPALTDLAHYWNHTV